MFFFSEANLRTQDFAFENRGILCLDRVFARSCLFFVKKLEEYGNLSAMIHVTLNTRKDIAK
ncbi:hypothetical protein COW36_13730 [bacterium (Candidatus Blackallbacteria) CG17_big_fil_post_rev_8_21_14_2_50_48_46]|uniref:Uncharacterized protein n=1 Tax=bacterium (Candidatus Blackallbacteria) CG17_big_fil_post_rev_8_21_14_2_50_48_46 TaxID=2014261 RepID=A0A2M7G306_9BACT|nr:MAG: hypothetical protein COW64_07245 [bacterium (Candidatus Blackallbacteria) CG18_big_fil_WC_8_21_14_2_50_49_26]PIW16189.1 MAG: hypothetical protein COW36_13730 [bacterium (Candidatus Blackallbacteria) CG17_big_fil_post_rev_8_21_14_2_50_48_46]PIW49929.1 MAG: hypothetical protein COW20_04575 [bacterium (Candidatus Blackallbacteria) CG13_big_fil_rev_8_21_14_2_50_49_14]